MLLDDAYEGSQGFVDGIGIWKDCSYVRVEANDVYALGVSSRVFATHSVSESSG